MMSSSQFGDTGINLIQIYKLMTERRINLSVQAGPFFRYGYAVLVEKGTQKMKNCTVLRLFFYRHLCAILL